MFHFLHAHFLIIIPFCLIDLSSQLVFSHFLIRLLYSNLFNFTFKIVYLSLKSFSFIFKLSFLALAKIKTLIQMLFFLFQSFQKFHGEFTKVLKQLLHFFKIWCFKTCQILILYEFWINRKLSKNIIFWLANSIFNILTENVDPSITEINYHIWL